MKVVILTGRVDALGRRVLARVQADRDVDDVEILDVEVATTGDLKPVLEGTDVVVHLGPGLGDAWDETTSADAVERARRIFDAGGDAGVGHIVVLSSATVYGAWANNPVPLTEEAAIRPNPGFAPAVAAAEIERLLVEWREGHPSTTATVLRPAVPVAEGAASWLARALRGASGIRAGDPDPPGQFVHLDDLAAAIDVARRARLDGPINVAPDGWIPGEQLRALAGGPRVRLPAAIASRLAVPGITPYALHPWVISNDRLRAAGWAPEHTNEEAYVAGHPPGPWATLSPRRRQELALGGAGVAVAGALTAAGLLLRRAARRR